MDIRPFLPAFPARFGERNGTAGRPFRRATRSACVARAGSPERAGTPTGDATGVRSAAVSAADLGVDRRREGVERSGSPVTTYVRIRRTFGTT
ncbi:hypothetical protein [Haladaptatus salinisoli]|uniref:hypothetical protein n=1 Tax=Haladaptatus salinisoli TaxID=2884876 RepID=UPI001D0AE93E|nr:hypothetical protein [Haladaptatus salinisoli]